MDGWWDCVVLNQFFYHIMGARLDRKLRASRAALCASLKTRLFQKKSRGKAFETGRRHYDIGNDLFTVMLDRQIYYSCAYWKQADNLDADQEAKLDLTCRKPMIKEGIQV
jgi:cyclopropane-fatty-acyl-phospholipid synthase